MTKNKRQHRRIRSKGIAAQLQTEEGPTAYAVENLSRGGAFLRTSRVLPVGTPLSLNLTRPGMKKSVRVTGRVANSVDPQTAARRGVTPGMGIEFDPLAPLESARVAQLIRELGGEVTAYGPPPRVAGDASREITHVVATPEPPPLGDPGPTPPHGESAQALLADIDPPPTMPATEDEQQAAHTGENPDTDPEGREVSAAAALERGRLMVQIEGLLMQVGDLRLKLDDRDRELAQLRKENEILRQELLRRDDV